MNFLTSRNIITILSLAVTPTFFSGCVAEKEVSAMNIKMRTMDNRIVDLERNVDTMKRVLEPGASKGSLETMQRQQAELGELAERLKAEILQVKGQLEESAHHYQRVRQDSNKTTKDLHTRLDEIENAVKSLDERLARGEIRMEGSVSNLRAMEEARAREAAERATVAARTAREAEQRAAQDSSQRTINAERMKKKTEDEQDTPASNTVESGQDAYGKALQAYKENNYKEAYKLFSSFIEKNPNSNNVPNARYWMADSLYSQKDYELAILEYQKVIADYPRHSKVSAALLKQGLAFERLGDKETARIVYQKLINEYPKSEELETAKKRLATLN